MYLNRIAVEADVRVLIGTIEPHPQAGFGGGLKNLLPGLAAAITIGHNHLLTPSAAHYSLVGYPPDENPMRIDLEEGAKLIPRGCTFLVNVVLNPTLDPVAVVAGDPIEAHRAGVHIARTLYGVLLPRPVDVVMTNAHPLDADMRQAGKALLNCAPACRRGGVILGFLRCPEGLANVRLPRLILPFPWLRALARGLGDRGIALVTRRLVPAVPPEARFLLRLTLHMLKDYHVLIYSPRLHKDCLLYTSPSPRD